VCQWLAHGGAFLNEETKDKPKEAPTSLTILDQGKFQMVKTFV